MHLKLRRNNKAVSTIFGMVFFLLVVVIVFASFAVVLNQTVNLEGTMTQTRQLDNYRSTEQLGFTGTPSYDPATQGFVCNIKNIGPLSAEIVRIWVQDLSGSKPSGSLSIEPSAPHRTLQPNEEQTYSGLVTVQGAISAHSFRFWFETARGNQFSILPGIAQQGDPGLDGTKWYTGTTYTHIPNNPPPNDYADPATGVTPNNGDYYLNLDTFDLFLKAGGSWFYLTNLKTSSHGVNWYHDSVTPNFGNTVGALDRDYFLNTATGDIYTMASGSWGLIYSGSTGGHGVAWYNAAATPVAGNTVGSKDGDYFLNTVNGDIYKKASGSWNLIYHPHGIKWYNGVGAATTVNPAGNLLGDYYIDTSTGKVWEQKSSGAAGWVMVYDPSHRIGYTVANGIGFIGMNFTTFYHYEGSSSYKNGSPVGSPVFANNYTLPSSASNFLFHVSLTNVDPDNDIVLNHLSCLYLIGSHSGTVKYATPWRLATVVGGIINTNPGDSAVILPKDQAREVDVYFYGPYPYGIDSGEIYPVNIQLYGTRGPYSYGQNLPFVSVYLP
jgi:hypothetical protein